MLIFILRGALKRHGSLRYQVKGATYFSPLHLVSFIRSNNFSTIILKSFFTRSAFTLKLRKSTLGHPWPADVRCRQYAKIDPLPPSLAPVTLTLLGRRMALLADIAGAWTVSLLCVVGTERCVTQVPYNLISNDSWQSDSWVVMWTHKLLALIEREC